MSAEEAGRVCQSCALFCDGTLISHAPVTPSEVDRARAAGLQVEARAGGTLSLRLPCTALENRGCSVYASRPGACRAFRCALYVEVEEGRASPEAALRIIEEARAIRARAVDHTLDAFLKAHFL